MAAQLVALPDAMVQLDAFTDPQGQTKYNQQLSARRGEAVRKYLVEKGVNPARISVVPLGATAPIKDPSLPRLERYALDRRVDIQILPMNGYVIERYEQFGDVQATVQHRRARGRAEAIGPQLRQVSAGGDRLEAGIAAEAVELWFHLQVEHRGVALGDARAPAVPKRRRAIPEGHIHEREVGRRHELARGLAFQFRQQRAGRRRLAGSRQRVGECRARQPVSARLGDRALEFRLRISRASLLQQCQAEPGARRKELG